MIAELAEPTARHPLHCDCCGTEVIAERIGNRLIIKQKRHGRMHSGVIILSELGSGIELLLDETTPSVQE